MTAAISRLADSLHYITNIRYLAGITVANWLIKSTITIKRFYA